MIRFGAALISLAVLLAPATRARADSPPEVWDIAKDPEARDRWELHKRIERLLHLPISEEVLPEQQRRNQELRLEAARAMLEQAGAATSPDVRLRFDLGIVYEQLATIDGRNDLHQRTIDVLAPALALAPDHPAATEALESLVYAYAKLDEPKEELAAWRRFVARLADPRARATPLMNMGEAAMRLGRLDEAIGIFQNVLQICGTLSNSSASNSTYALTLWDLAVALDRSGDPRGAMEAASKARQHTWIEPAPSGRVRKVTGWDAIRDQENVFFVPAWEREWYLALGYASAAREERDARAAANLWAQAEEHWSTYAARAANSRNDAGEGHREDRWLAIASLRRDRAHAERAGAALRAGKQAPTKKEEPIGEEHSL